jgi:GNAT superfamily N-acetyltransferase
VYQSDLPILIKMGERAFKLSALIVADLIANIDLHYSRKVMVDNIIVGYYILRPKCVIDTVVSWGMIAREDLTPYRTKHGVEGVALVVDSEYRGHGIGKMLMDLPRQFGFEYVWGNQTKSLDNIHHWLKRRRLVARLGQLFVTVQDLV